jgi:hypothetical protein
MLLVKNGFHTYATVRNNTSKSKTIIENAKKHTLPLQVLELDVTSDKSVDDAIRYLIKTWVVSLVPINVKFDCVFYLFSIANTILPLGCTSF